MSDQPRTSRLTREDAQAMAARSHATRRTWKIRDLIEGSPPLSDIQVRTLIAALEAHPRQGE